MMWKYVCTRDGVMDGLFYRTGGGAFFRNITHVMRPAPIRPLALVPAFLFGAALALQADTNFQSIMSKSQLLQRVSEAYFVNI